MFQNLTIFEWSKKVAMVPSFDRHHSKPAKRLFKLSLSVNRGILRFLRSYTLINSELNVANLFASNGSNLIEVTR